MTFTLAFGWWMLPLVISVAIYGYAVSTFQRGGGDYSFPELFNLIRLIIATVPVLAVWLVWALLR